MSASRDKRKRQLAKAQGILSPKKDEKRGMGPAGRIAVTAISVVVVLGLICLILFGAGVPQKLIPAATIEGESVTTAELEYYYDNAVTTFLSYYGSYIETDKPLSQQAFSGDQTLADYILGTALSNAKAAIHWKNLALAENVTLTDEDNFTLEQNIKEAQKAADGQSISLNKLLRNYYGRGMDEKIFRKLMERELLAGRYQTIHRDEFTYTESDIAKRYDENKNDYDLVDYRKFSFSTTLTAEQQGSYTSTELAATSTTIVNGTETTLTMGENIIFKLAKAFSETPGLTEETFNKLASETLPEASRTSFDEDPDYTLEKNVTFNDTSDLDDWAFDADRKLGDIGVLKGSSSFDVVLFVERRQNTANTVNLYAAPFSDEAAAKKAFEKLDAPDLDAFIKFAKENSSSIAARWSGGEVKEYAPAPNPAKDSADEWLAAVSRKAGDITQIGANVMYYVSAGRPAWQVAAESDLRQASFSSFSSEKYSSEDSNATVSYTALSWLLIDKK
ncbi:hypothetical protein FACS1894217_09580 [Clostridia bacterium]|nr:hypothetical protein FACS1894217_09580 [Clostridia bacterium]